MFERRLNWAYGAFCAALLVICIKVFVLQVLQISLEEPGSVLHPPRPWQAVPAVRGAILDRHDLKLAADRPRLDLAIGYDQLRYPKFWLRPLQEATGLSEGEFLGNRRRIMDRVRAIRREVLSLPRHRRIRQKISEGKMREWEWKIYEETIPHTMVSGVSLEVASRVQAAPERFPGVSVETRLVREYPGSDAVRHVVGHLGEAQRDELTEDSTVSPGDRIGRNGVEKRYDPILRGSPGLSREEMQARVRPGGKFDPLLGGVSGGVRKQIDQRAGARRRLTPLPAEPGSCVFLTLDQVAQQRAVDALAGEEGAVVVMDVSNGELLVLATAPLDQQFNRPIQGRIPPGSVMKPIVALAAAAAGVGGPGTTADCAGAIRIGGRTCHCSHAHGRTDMRKGIAHSCNVYFWRLGLGTGVEPIVKMAGDLGFGTRTGLDLPYESPGHLPCPSSPVNLSIGQGNLQVTPLQVAVAMAAIANGGKVLRPRILLKVEPGPSPEDAPEIGPGVLREIRFSPDTLQAVREGMRAAVTSGTVSDEPRLKVLGVAAKTGTAQTGDPERNHAWLAGYVPFDAPRYAFAVVVHNTPLSGARAAGPIVAEVLDVLLRDR